MANQVQRRSPIRGRYPSDARVLPRWLIQNVACDFYSWASDILDILSS
jgi:hypothetical protein